MIPQEDYQGFTKDEIMNTLLRICPPDSGSMEHSQQDRAGRGQNMLLEMMSAGS